MASEWTYFGFGVVAGLTVGLAIAVTWARWLYDQIDGLAEDKVDLGVRLVKAQGQRWRGADRDVVEHDQHTFEG